jgi:hypothetical protein
MPVSDGGNFLLKDNTSVYQVVHSASYLVVRCQDASLGSSNPPHRAAHPHEPFVRLRSVRVKRVIGEILQVNHRNAIGFLPADEKHVRANQMHLYGNRLLNSRAWATGNAIVH